MFRYGLQAPEKGFATNTVKHNRVVLKEIPANSLVLWQQPPPSQEAFQDFFRYNLKNNLT